MSRRMDLQGAAGGGEEGPWGAGRGMGGSEQNVAGAVAGTDRRRQNETEGEASAQEDGRGSEIQPEVVPG